MRTTLELSVYLLSKRSVLPKTVRTKGNSSVTKREVNQLIESVGKEDEVSRPSVQEKMTSERSVPPRSTKKM